MTVQAAASVFYDRTTKATNRLASSWAEFDHHTATEGWEHHRKAQRMGGERWVSECKSRPLPNGGIEVVYPPLGQPRPETMVCPDCEGVGMVLENVYALSRDPRLSCEDERWVGCSRCLSTGRVRRDVRGVVMPLSPGLFGSRRVGGGEEF